MLSTKSKSVTALAIAFLVIANGWHLGALQIFAWSNMALHNADSMAYNEAILKALDGTEICGICEIVINAQNAENDHDLQTIEVITKSLLILEKPLSLLTQPNSHQRIIPHEPLPLISCHHIPDSPPPRINSAA